MRENGLSHTHFMLVLISQCDQIQFCGREEKESLLNSECEWENEKIYKYIFFFPSVMKITE